ELWVQIYKTFVENFYIQFKGLNFINVVWPLARLGSQNEMHLPPCALVLPPPPPPKQQPSLLTHTRSPLLTSLWPAHSLNAIKYILHIFSIGDDVEALTFAFESKIVTISSIKLFYNENLWERNGCTVREEELENVHIFFNKPPDNTLEEYQLLKIAYAKTKTFP
ncbi:Protein of unknown function, partial [Gryllus bimaculatus]